MILFHRPTKGSIPLSAGISLCYPLQLIAVSVFASGTESTFVIDMEQEKHRSVREFLCRRERLWGVRVVCCSTETVSIEGAQSDHSVAAESVSIEAMP